MACTTALHEYLQELQKMHRQCNQLRENLLHLELCGDAQLLATLTDKCVVGLTCVLVGGLGVL